MGAEEAIRAKKTTDSPLTGQTWSETPWLNLV